MGECEGGGGPGGGPGAVSDIELLADGLLGCIARALSRSPSLGELVSAIVRDSKIRGQSSSITVTLGRHLMLHRKRKSETLTGKLQRIWQMILLHN